MDRKKFLEDYSVEREGTGSLKWDALEARFGNADLLPLWVADMEFSIPEVVKDAMKKRVDHGVFGYAFSTPEYLESVVAWMARRHNERVEKEWIRSTPGIVSLIYWAVNAFTEEGDAVIIQSPVYYPFHNAVKDTKRKLVRSELKHDEKGYYSMDLVDFEQKIKAENVKMFILCSPHNPVGRVWLEEELAAVLKICKDNKVLVISDEIHQDIILNGNKFISSLSVEKEAYHENLIVCSAPSKTFNMAGLLNSNIIIPDEKLRQAYDAKMKAYNQVELSVLGQCACQAAYNHGETWLSGLLKNLEFNFQMLKDKFKEGAPKAVVSELQGTYLAWIDLSPYLADLDMTEFMQDRCKIAIDYGEWFSDECSKFIRINLATSPENVEKAVDNIIRELKKL